MTQKDYPWRRFWCPPDGTLPLTDDGYLLDPESGWLSPAGDQVKPFDAIADVPCLGLLTETDWLIDQVVYRLYGLIKDEIKVVEGER